MSDETIRFYCGVNETDWNHHPVTPGKYACIAPVCGRSLRTKKVNRASVPRQALVIQDSGAFSDGPGQRLSLDAALKRQVAHAQMFGYADQITHQASYDLLIDEKWEAGCRLKQRWSEQEAIEAVEETVEAAAYLAKHRCGNRLILSIQGVSVKQYLACAQRIIPLLEPGDLLGLGGWCILGKKRSLFPAFCETMTALIPLLGHEGVKQVHLWGVCWAPALEVLTWLATSWGIQVSVDSAHPSFHPALGQWGYANWRDNTYQQPPVLESCRQHLFEQCVGCRGLERIRHVVQTSTWLAHFPVQAPTWLNQPRQLSLLEEYL